MGISFKLVSAKTSTYFAEPTVKLSDLLSGARQVDYATLPFANLTLRR